MMLSSLTWLATSGKRRLEREKRRVEWIEERTFSVKLISLVSKVYYVLRKDIKL